MSNRGLALHLQASMNDRIKFLEALKEVEDKQQTVAELIEKVERSAQMAQKLILQELYDDSSPKT